MLRKIFQRVAIKFNFQSAKKLVTVITRQTRRKVKEKKEVTFTAMVREPSNLWVELIELLDSINNVKLTDSRKKQKISESSNTASKIEYLIKCNTDISITIDTRWKTLSKEDKKKIEKAVQLQVKFKEYLGDIKYYRLNESLPVLVNSILKKRYLLDEYKYSLEKAYISLLDAIEEIEISNEDLAYAICNSGF